MWLLTNYIRRLAQEEANEQIQSVLKGYKRREQEFLKQQIEGVSNHWALLADNHATAPIGEEVVLMERAFEHPVELTGYIDAMGLTGGDSCGINLQVQMFGRKTLTPLYSATYNGPVEDFVVLHPQIVLGNVKITHIQGSGTPKIIAYKFFSR